MEKAILDQLLSELKRSNLLVVESQNRKILLCDAVSKEAVYKVFQIASKESLPEVALLFPNINQVAAYFNDVPEIVYDLFELTNSPLEIILGNAKNIETTLCNSNGFIAIRLAQSDAFKLIGKQFRKPLAMWEIKGTELPSTIHTIKLKLEEPERKKHQIIEIGPKSTFRIIQSK